MIFCLYKTAVKAKLLLLAMTLASVFSCAALAVDEPSKNEIQQDIDSGRYESATEKVRAMLQENGEDTDLLLFHAKLIGNPAETEYYDPQAALAAYEKAYTLLAESGAPEETLAKLRAEINEAWMRAILDSTIDIEEDSVKDYARFAGSIVPVFLHFEAVWCPPCRQMLIDVKSFDIMFLDKVLVIREDIDKNEKVLEEKYAIKSIPYNVFIDRKGNEMTVIGAMDRKKLFAAYYVISDFFYEDKMMEGEGMLDYMNRVYASLEPLDEDAMNEVISGKKSPVPEAAAPSQPAGTEPSDGG